MAAAAARVARAACREDMVSVVAAEGSSNGGGYSDQVRGGV